MGRGPSIALSCGVGHRRGSAPVAVVQAESCNCNSAPSLGTSICLRCSPKKTEKKKKSKERKERQMKLPNPFSQSTRFLRNRMEFIRSAKHLFSCLSSCSSVCFWMFSMNECCIHSSCVYVVAKEHFANFIESFTWLLNLVFSWICNVSIHKPSWPGLRKCEGQA